MTCTATIEVGGETLTCEQRLGGHYPEAHHSVPLRTGGFITWTDEAPGAVPHRDPEPTYRVKPADEFGGPCIVSGTRVVAEFTGAHPDPQGAAEEAARHLNEGRWSAPWDVIRERNEAQAKYDMVCRRCDDITAERDRFLRALEQIAGLEGADHINNDPWMAQDLARQVLDGGTP